MERAPEAARSRPEGGVDEWSNALGAGFNPLAKKRDNFGDPLTFYNLGFDSAKVSQPSLSGGSVPLGNLAYFIDMIAKLPFIPYSLMVLRVKTLATSST